MSTYHRHAYNTSSQVPQIVTHTIAMEAAQHHPDDLECPVCRDIMEAPIWYCKVGHNICDDCNKNVSICPMCRGEMIGERNHALEEYGRTVSYKGTNELDGCDFQAGIEEIKGHNKFCKYTVTQCPLRCLDNCKWSGKIQNIMSHCKQKHPNNTYSTTKQKLICKDFLEEQSSFTMTFKHYFLIFEVEGEMFKLTWDLNCSTKFMLWRVIYLGPDEGAAKFKFSVDFQNPINVHDKLHLEGHCQPQDVNKMMSSKMYIPTKQRNMAQYCLDSDLHYTISIFKAETKDLGNSNKTNDILKRSMIIPEGCILQF